MYASVWKVPSDWGCSRRSVRRSPLPVLGDDEIGLRESVPSEFDTGTTSTTALHLIGDFTRRTFDALELTDVPPPGVTRFLGGARGRSRRGVTRHQTHALHADADGPSVPLPSGMPHLIVAGSMRTHCFPRGL